MLILTLGYLHVLCKEELRLSDELVNQCCAYFLSQTTSHTIRGLNTLRSTNHKSVEDIDTSIKDYFYRVYACANVVLGEKPLFSPQYIEKKLKPLFIECYKKLKQDNKLKFENELLVPVYGFNGSDIVPTPVGTLFSDEDSVKFATSLDKDQAYVNAAIYMIFASAFVTLKFILQSILEGRGLVNLADYNYMRKYMRRLYGGKIKELNEIVFSDDADGTSCSIMFFSSVNNETYLRSKQFQELLVEKLKKFNKAVRL